MTRASTGLLAPVLANRWQSTHSSAPNLPEGPHPTQVLLPQGLGTGCALCLEPTSAGHPHGKPLHHLSKMYNCHSDTSISTPPPILLSFVPCSRYWLPPNIYWITYLLCSLSIVCLLSLQGKPHEAGIFLCTRIPFGWINNVCVCVCVCIRVEIRTPNCWRKLKRLSCSHIFFATSISSVLIQIKRQGVPGWLSGWASVFNSGCDPGSQDRVLHQAPRREPTSPSAYVSTCLSVSLISK